MIKRKRARSAYAGRRMACVVFVALEIISAGLSHALRAAPAVSTQTGQRPATSTTQSSDDGVEVLPERVLQHVTRGDQFAAQGHFEEAVEEYRAAIKEDAKRMREYIDYLRRKK